MYVESAVLFVAAAVASLFMAWVVGAGSSGATPFAPAVGADAIPVLRAAFLVGILGFAGAVLQGSNVTETVGGGLVHGVTLSPVAVVFVLVVAAGLMLLGILAGIPIAMAFTVTGTVVGTGLALGGTPAWDTYRTVLAVWVLTPFVGGGLAYGIARVLPREDVPERLSIPLLAGVVGAVTANVGFAPLGPPGTSRTVAAVLGAPVAAATPVGRLAASAVVTVVVGATVAALVYRLVRAEPERGIRRVLVALGALVAFSAGGTQVGLAVGPLVPLLDEAAVPLVAALVGGGVGILVGSWTGAPRMIQALSSEYSSLGPRRSVAALVPSFAIAQAAVLLGVPVSFNEIVVSAIVGSGAAVGGSDGVSRGKVVRTVGAWVGSFLVAFGLGYGVFGVVG
jgi:PiT family inorganic phosphate transporter